MPQIMFKKLLKKGKSFFSLVQKDKPLQLLQEEAQKCNQHYINHRWLGGILTNWSTVQKRVEYLKRAKQKEESGEFDRLPKKEAALLRRERMINYIKILVV